MEVRVDGCTHMYACSCTYDIIGIPQWGLPFAIEIIMCNMYAYVCACR